MERVTVADLIATLEGMDPGAVVRLATQPSWPFEYSIGDVEEVTSEDGERVVYLAEGSQLGYLPGDASEALGWR